ncbi:hypothetical protein SAMN05444358_104164 [Ruegeria halocynthiae]|uniref:Uncharacterized protein n=1 Tax=Ruegeria halocynthiae TaxID=985054 RepID=A0A1H3AHK6_9RHOB|nr:hypothetical protein [Ruegeria halocynthiae]SDX28664.1 hypothetical protein SAMN05444358_104164 [Ruegeria halocynthiae]
MVRSFLVALILAAQILVMPARADSSLGQAVALWLQGDDMQALPMLAELAAEGDVDARLLLGRIETSDLGLSPYRQSLGPERSRKLFRQKDWSAFGQSWLTVEARAGNELAQALQQAKRPEPDLDLIAKLNAFGEHQATDYPTRIVALYGDVDMREKLLADDQVMQALKPYLTYLSQTPEPRGDGLAALRHIQPEPVDASSDQALGMAGLLALGLGYGDVSPDNPWRVSVESWLMSSDSTRPIAQLCTEHCADDAPACAFAFLALTGGYFEAIRIDSPLETVIPQEEFLDSPRARLMVLRRAALARTETNLDWLSSTEPAAALSACAIKLINEERQAYK